MQITYIKQTLDTGASAQKGKKARHRPIKNVPSEKKTKQLYAGTILCVAAAAVSFYILSVKNVVRR